MSFLATDETNSTIPWALLALMVLLTLWAFTSCSLERRTISLARWMELLLVPTTLCLLRTLALILLLISKSRKVSQILYNQGTLYYARVGLDQ